MADKSAKPKSASKKSRNPVLLWAGLGLLLILAGIALAFFFMNRGAQDGNRLSIFKDLGAAKDKALGTKPQAPERPRETTHKVQPGENLWSIAGKGNMVDSAWEWRTILVQNKDKIGYAFISEDENSWKVMVEEGQELKVRREPMPAAGPVGKKFAVQLVALPDRSLGHAMRLVKMLLKDGHYAYLYLKDIDGKNRYRVRVGFYPTAEQAHAAAQGLMAQYAEKKIFNEYWVTIPSDRELRGEQLDFGAQEMNPWVVQLPERQTHAQALEDLRKVSKSADFVYIAQKHGTASSSYIYRTRVGFFPTEEKAQAFQVAQAKAVPLLSEGQRVKVEGFEEALPGQNLKLSKPKS